MHLKQAGLRRESRGVMGLKISFQRSRRKTGPVQAPSPSRESDSDEERSFDDINLNESNPFLPSNRETAVPHSLKPFIEEKADFCGHLNFYTDAVSCVTVSGCYLISLISSHYLFNMYASRHTRTTVGQGGPTGEKSTDLHGHIFGTPFSIGTSLVPKAPL